jgi:hypothetical protein
MLKHWERRAQSCQSCWCYNSESLVFCCLGVAILGGNIIIYQRSEATVCDPCCSAATADAGCAVPDNMPYLGITEHEDKYSGRG